MPNNVILSPKVDHEWFSKQASGILSFLLIPEAVTALAQERCNRWLLIVTTISIYLENMNSGRIRLQTTLMQKAQGDSKV